MNRSPFPWLLLGLLALSVTLGAVLGPMNKCPTPNLRFDEYGLEGLHNGGFWYFWHQATEGITFLNDETGDPVEITDMTLYWRSRPLKSGECYNYGNMTWYPMGGRNSQTNPLCSEKRDGWTHWFSCPTPTLPKGLSECDTLSFTGTLWYATRWDSLGNRTYSWTNWDKVLGIEQNAEIPQYYHEDTHELRVLHIVKQDFLDFGLREGNRYSITLVRPRWWPGFWFIKEATEIGPPTREDCGLPTVGLTSTVSGFFLAE